MGRAMAAGVAVGGSDLFQHVSLCSATACEGGEPWVRIFAKCKRLFVFPARGIMDVS